MSAGLLTAGAGQSWENELVAALDRPDAALTVLRRCVDIADVLALAATGQVAVAVLAGALRHLDSDAVIRLRVAGVAAVAVYPAGDERARERLARLGLSVLVPDDLGGAGILDAALTAAAEIDSRRQGSPGDRGLADPRRSLPPRAPDTEPAVPVGGSPSGRVVAVWGPTGAPGRTTVAAGVAVALARSGISTLLMDADVYGGVAASLFGLLDESPGLAGACRQAANGRLDLAGLIALSWSLEDGLRLLSGVSRADRWPEIRPSAIGGVLSVAREAAQVTVVDCGFCLEADEEISFDTLAPRRNGATLAILAQADIVVAVGSADPPGMERLVRGIGELRDIVPEAKPTVVLNRCRPTAASEEEAIVAVRRFVGAPVAAHLPEDRAGTDKAWRRGAPLADVAAGSPLVAGLNELARTLVPGGRRSQQGRARAKR